MKFYLKRIPHSFVVFILAFLAVLSCSSLSTRAAVRPTDVSSASSGNILVLVPGEFATADVSAILNQINGYRKEACQNGYPNPDNSSAKLTMADYSEVQWSGDLEWIAQIRAAEGSVLQDHTRPNGDSCFSIQHNGISSWGETLAWNYGSLLGGITQWYGEKEDWVNQNSYAVTGHYTEMIAPSIKYIGIGCFTSQSGAWTCVAGEFSSRSGLSTAPQGLYGMHSQVMEVPSSDVSLKGDSSVVIGKNVSYSSLAVSMPGIMGGTVTTPALPYGTCSWSSSNPSVATISSSGVLAAKAYGSATITLLSQGAQIKKTVTVTKPVKGTSFSSGSANYKITDASGEVAFLKDTAASGSAVIPDSVTFAGSTYKVTSVAANAFKGSKTLTTVKIGQNVKTIGTTAFANCKALKSVTIGSNVQSIGKKAFYNCKKLKTVTIKSKKLKSSKVGSKAFGKTGIKKVKVPKNKKKAYKGWLYKKGLSKKAKIK